MNKLTKFEAFASQAGPVNLQVIRPTKFGPDYFIRERWFSRFIPLDKPKFLPRFIGWPKTRRDALEWELADETQVMLKEGNNALDVNLDFPDGSVVAINGVAKFPRSSP